VLVELTVTLLFLITTVWDSPSPKFIMGGSDEEKFDHPTQKPVELRRRLRALLEERFNLSPVFAAL